MRKMHQRDPKKQLEPHGTIDKPEDAGSYNASSARNRRKRARSASPSDVISDVVDLGERCRLLETKVARLERVAEERERELERLRIENEVYAGLVRGRMAHQD